MAKVIYPPRPKSAIPPKELEYYEKQGVWCLQYKYNGSRSVIHIEADGTVSVWSRHGDAHRSWTLSASIRDQLLALPGLVKGQEYWLDGELLIKTFAEDTKGKIVLFDVLQAGKYLFLKPDQMGRLAMLDEICGKPRTLDSWRGMGYVISEDLLMAPTFIENFKARFNEDRGDEVEGLVLRRKDAGLDNFGQKEYECSWIIRCRKPHKNYNF
jgi:ATP-dependent DNA ligase